MSRVGIVAEGGGTKAAYSAGVLKCLLEHDIVLPYCVGISAGTEILLSYVSKQVDRLEVTGIDAPCQKGVVGLRPFLKEGSIFGIEATYDFIESSKVDIPESMVAREVESLKADYKQRLAYQGIDWDTLVKSQGGVDHLEETLKEDALRRIKNSLVIDKIAKAENIKLEPKDLEHKFAELSAIYGLQQPDIIKQIGQNPEALGSISQQALNDKVRDFLVANNSVEIVAPKKQKVESK